MQPRLVRERGVTDVGLVGVRGDVGDLADSVRDPAHLGQTPGRDHLLALLELQARHHAEQVCVAGPFAVAVGRALDVADPGGHRGQRVRHRAGGVVVAVDAQARSGRRADRRHHLTEFARQHAAVGIAERDDLGAGFGRHPDHFKRVRGVRPVSVKEVLGVEEHPLSLGAQMPDGIGDHREVLRQRGPQGSDHVPVVALGNQRHDRRAGLAQRGHLRIVGGDRARPGWRQRPRVSRWKARAPYGPGGRTRCPWGWRRAIRPRCSQLRTRPGAARWPACRPPSG